MKKNIKNLTEYLIDTELNFKDDVYFFKNISKIKKLKKKMKLSELNQSVFYADMFLRKNYNYFLYVDADFKVYDGSTFIMEYLTEKNPYYQQFMGHYRDKNVGRQLYLLYPRQIYSTRILLFGSAPYQFNLKLSDISKFTKSWQKYMKSDQDVDLKKGINTKIIDPSNPDHSAIYFKTLCNDRRYYHRSDINRHIKPIRREIGKFFDKIEEIFSG